ncbi:MAG: hypothetical protein JJ895_11650 [Balneolaceae bacterium]|nr:hypothetical protein [Balneolaceae bacterium]
MKKLSSLFIFLTLFSITLTAQVRSYNLETGAVFTVSVDQSQEISQIIMGNPNTINTSNTATEQIEVLGQTDDGLYNIKVTTLTQKTEMKSPMMNMTMDSEDASTGNGLFAAIKGSSYTFTMSATGDIKEINGLDEIIEKVNAKVEDNPQLKAQIDAIFGEETIRTSLRQRFSIYNNDSANEWTRNEDSNINNMPVEMTTTYSYQDDTTIGAESDIKIDATTVQMGMNVDMQLEGTQQATYKLNAATGIPTTFESVNDISGNAQTQGMQIPMTIKTVTKTTFTAN